MISIMFLSLEDYRTLRRFVFEQALVPEYIEDIFGRLNRNLNLHWEQKADRIKAIDFPWTADINPWPGLGYVEIKCLEMVNKECAINYCVTLEGLIEDSDVDFEFKWEDQDYYGGVVWKVFYV